MHLKIQHLCTSNGLKLVLALCTCTPLVSAVEIAQCKYITEEEAGYQTGPRNYVSMCVCDCVFIDFVFF